MPGTTGPRWTVFDLRGAARSFPRDIIPFFRDNKAPYVRGTDALGRILTSQSLARTPGAPRVFSNLLLVNRATMKVDTIGRVDAGAMPRQSTVAEVERNGD